MQDNKIVDYITEEVRRQGFDTKTSEGMIRVKWMLDAWRWAWIHRSEPLTINFMRDLGIMVEVSTNYFGFRTEAVHLRNTKTGETEECPPPYAVVPRLERLVEAWNERRLTPLELYKDFCVTHPFYDGNGRTGKILLNWANHTLDDPIFPPNDFWGYHIINP